MAPAVITAPARPTGTTRSAACRCTPLSLSFVALLTAPAPVVAFAFVVVAVHGIVRLYARDAEESTATSRGRSTDRSGSG